MLAQLKLDIADDTQVLAARHLTLVRSSLWDQAEAPSADWAEANPEKLMAFLMVYFGVKSYRDNVAGGRVTFGRALQVGLLITVLASACYVAT